MPARTVRRANFEVESMFARISPLVTSVRSLHLVQPLNTNFYKQWKLDKIKDIAARQRESQARTPEERIAELDRRQEPARKERAKLAEMLGKKQLPITQ